MSVFVCVCVLLCASLMCVHMCICAHDSDALMLQKVLRYIEVKSIVIPQYIPTSGFEMSLQFWFDIHSL